MHKQLEKGAARKEKLSKQGLWKSLQYGNTKRWFGAAYSDELQSCF